MKKAIYYLSAVLILAVVMVAFFVMRGNADTVREKEMVAILFESVKAMDAERYLGRDSEHLSSATEEQQKKIQTEYTALLEELYDGDSMVNRCLSVFEQMKGLEMPGNLRSVDMICMDYQIHSFDIAGTEAKINVTWNSCEKVIDANEDGSYTAGFPLSQTTMEAVFTETKEGWKLQGSEILNNIIGEEDVALRKTFPAFTEAYDYAITAEPSVPEELILKK